MRLPRWAWVIAAVTISVIVLSFVLERVFPESDDIESIGRDSIATATGHQVTSISCKRTLHIRSDMNLPCDVALDNGTKFETVAHVHAHYRYANHYSFRATFSPVPGQRQPKPVPTRTSNIHTPADAERLGDCVTAAGTDPAKIQACASGM